MAMLRLRKFMFERVYLGPTARSEHARVERTMTGLFDHYLANPGMIPALDPGADDAQRVTDYIAGMTDRYCIAPLHRPGDPRGGAVLVESTTRWR